MAASENDKKVVLDALRDLGAKDVNTAKGVDLVLGKARNKGPRYSSKPTIAEILIALQNEKKVIRKAGEKAASYYLAPAAVVAPKPVTTVFAQPVTPEPKPEEKKKSDNPYL